MGQRMRIMGSMMSLFILSGCSSGETSLAEAEQDIIDPTLDRTDDGSADQTDPADTRTKDCRDDSDCGDLQYCATPPGQCGMQGACVARGISLFCVSRYQPVCGCNGQSFRNECFAHKAGVAIHREGECPAHVDSDRSGG